MKNKTTEKRWAGRARKKPEALSASPVMWNIQPSKNTVQEGTIKKNTEYDCWAFTTLFWLNKNLLVCSLKECKLHRFQQVSLNCSSKEVLVISCKTEEHSQKWSQEEAAWELLADLLILWVNKGRFQTFQSTTTTTKVVATTHSILKCSSLFSVFVKQENISEGATRKMESVTTHSQWKVWTGGLQQDLGLGVHQRGYLSPQMCIAGLKMLLEQSR